MYFISTRFCFILSISLFNLLSSDTFESIFVILSLNPSIFFLSFSITSTNELYLEILKSNLQNKKILVIGFAETATALSEFITHQSIIREDLNIVYHLQTTREDINTTINNIAFQEEHSHATNQKLYWNEKVFG